MKTTSPDQCRSKLWRPGGKPVKIEHNICQVGDGREANFSNITTTFGDYFFRDVDGGDITWSNVTTGPKIWFTAGDGTSGTGASDPAAASDYQMASALSYFEDTGGTPKPNRTVDSYEENSELDELVLIYKLARTGTGVGSTISEIGIYMADVYTQWDSVNTNRATYDLGDIYQSPDRPTLIARAVVPAENRITKGDGNEITWRWTLKFTG